MGINSPGIRDWPISISAYACRNKNLRLESGRHTKCPQPSAHLQMSLFSRVRLVKRLVHCNSSTFTPHHSRRFSLFPSGARTPKDQPFYEVKKPSILIKFTWTLLIADALCT